MFAQDGRWTRCGRIKTLLLGTLVMGLVPLPRALCAPQRLSPRHAVRVRQKVQYGVASWYGARSQGHLMACGEPFDEHALTAAHRTLPLGTKVRVTNLRNGRSVTVQIKDRGPVVPGRLIDLSKAAAARLGFVHHGLTPVKVRVVSLPPSKGRRISAAETSTEARLHIRTNRPPIG